VSIGGLLPGYCWTNGNKGCDARTVYLSTRLYAQVYTRFLTSGYELDPDTGVLAVVLEDDKRGYRNPSVIRIDSIVRGAHLPQIFDTSKFPSSLNYTQSLDYFRDPYCRNNI